MTEDYCLVPTADEIGQIDFVRNDGEESFRRSLARRMSELGWEVAREVVIPGPETWSRLGFVDIVARREGLVLAIECKLTRPWLHIGQVMFYAAGLRHRQHMAVVPILAAPAKNFGAGMQHLIRSTGVVPWPIELHYFLRGARGNLVGTGF